MKRYRVRAVLVLVLALSVSAGVVSASAPLPAAEDAAQEARTPEDICAEATQDLAEPETRLFPEGPDDVLEEGVDYWAVFCTAQGPVYLDLFEDIAPQAVNSLVFLAQHDYFNNTTFHRVLPGFMAQGGDPTATGTGGPGYTFEDETTDDLTFDRPGLLAMANSGVDTNGSQFFITHASTPWLDGQHTIFGEVYQGQGAVELLLPRDPEAGPSYAGDALETVVIVEDPSAVAAEEDAAPSVEHWQALLEQLIASLVGAPFALDEAESGVRDREAEAAHWQAAGDDELDSYVQDYLAEHGYEGTASIYMPSAECPPSPEDLPFWSLRFSVSDFGTAENAEAVVTDDARADRLVEGGAFESYSDAQTISGRIYRRPAEGEPDCGEATLYRFEYPAGRYLLAVETALDDSIVSDDADVTPEQFLVYLTDQILVGTVGGTLERGNAVAAE